MAASSDERPEPGQLTALHVGGGGSWHSLGFAGPGSFVVGSTTFVPRAEPGVVGSIEGVAELDGLELLPPPERGSDGAHPNGVARIDHVVVRTPDTERTVAAFEAAGFAARRQRRVDGGETPRLQTFFWFGDVICELVGPVTPEGDDPASWWGVALACDDLSQTCDALGEHASDIRPAVQPGRFVATVRRSAGLDVPVLLMSPHVGGR